MISSSLLFTFSKLFCDMHELPQGIEVLFVAGFGPVTTEQEASARLYRDVLSLPLRHVHIRIGANNGRGLAAQFQGNLGDVLRARGNDALPGFHTAGQADHGPVLRFRPQRFCTRPPNVRW